jgi:hypothetical protein
MNTDYGNYPKDLTKIREEFTDKHDALKKSYDQNLQSIADTHEQKEKQSKVINEERLKDVLNQNQEELVSLNEKAAQNLNHKQKQYMESLRESGDTYNHDKKVTKEKLEGKLTRAKDAFSDSLKQVQESNEAQIKEKDKNASNTLTENRNNSEEKIKNLQKSTEDTFSNFKNDVSKQKAEINQKHNSEMGEQFKRLRAETDKKTENFNSKINEVNRASSKEKEHIIEKDAATALVHKKDALESLENVENSYKNRNQEIVNDFQNKFTKLEEQSSQDIEKIKNNNIEDRETKLKENQVDLGKNVKTQEKDGQKIATEDSYERRLDTLKKQMSEQSQLYGRRSSEANAEALGKLKQYEEDAKDRIAVNTKRDHNEYEKLKLTSKQNSDRYQNEYNKKIENTQKKAELEVEKEKATSKEMLSRKQFIHNKEQNQISDINVKNLEYLKTQAKRERTALKTDAIRDLNDNVSEVKQHYQKKFDKSLEGYQQKFDEQGKLIEKIQEGTNDKIADIEQKAEKKIDNALLRSKAEREIEKNEFVERFNQLKDAYEGKFRDQKKDFDKELARTRKENSLFITSLTKKNDEEVRNLMESHTREMKRASDELRNEKEHGFRMANAEKENLVERYENKIVEVKNAYETDKVKLSENKRNERA